MSPWENLLEKPHPGEHYVQLYQADERALCRNVGRYIWKSLRRGDGVLIVATPDHRDLFCSFLERKGEDPSKYIDAKQLRFVDAHRLLAEFVVAGQPNWERFEPAIRKQMTEVKPARGAEALRAYGEMVGILWKRRQFRAAIRLEQLWNKLLEQSAFTLYCAYAIDLFGEDCQLSNLESILCTHTHLVPAETDGLLEDALNRSLDEVLGAEAESLRTDIRSDHSSPLPVMATAEKIVLWLRKHRPQQADQIIHCARKHYQLVA